MTTKEVERALVVSLVLSSLALTLAILCFPILQSDLDALTTQVHKDVDDFKDSTDSIWSDILALQLESRRDKRDEGNYLYKYQPSLRHKLKSSLPRSNFHRVHAAPTIQDNPGRQIFSDAELIGQLEKMGENHQTEYVKPKTIKQCPLPPNPKCPQGKTGEPGADGSDGENGAPGNDGKPGIDGVHLYEEQDKGCILCPMGPRGPKGPRGPRGEEGIQGFQGRPGRLTECPGPPGPRGPPGEPGEEGPRGLRGQQGVSVRKWIFMPGEKGPPGMRGPRGPAGPKGMDGEPGIEGVKGRRGPVGLAGVQGPPGERGLQGSYGRGGFDEHYCECPKRSKGVRGKFTLPLGGSYATETARDYPRDVYYDTRL